MRFGKIHSTIWCDEKFRQLKDCEKLLYMYLLSSESRNAIGVFRIGLGTIEDEYGEEDRAKLKAILKTLCDTGLIRYNFDSKWLAFNHFLKWNLPISPNHAKQIANEVNDTIKANAPKEYVYHFLNDVKPVLEGYSHGKGETSRTYFNDFKEAFDANLAAKYLGGEVVLADCINGKPWNDSSASQELNKSLPSSTEALRTKDNYNNNHNDNNTDKDTDKRVLDKSKSNVASEITIPCANGQSCAVGASAIRPVIEALGGELSVASVKIQSYILANGIFPPADKAEATAFINNEIMKAIDKGAIRS